MIDSLPGFACERFEPDPYEEVTRDIITLRATRTAVIAFQPGRPFDFSIDMLNLPSHGARVLCYARVILSNLVRHDLLRALSRAHQPGQSQSVAFGNVFQVDQLALSLFLFTPCELAERLIRLLLITFVQFSVGAVTIYVCDEFNRAETLHSGRKDKVGFALTARQR